MILDRALLGGVHHPEPVGCSPAEVCLVRQAVARTVAVLSFAWVLFDGLKW